MKLPKSKNERSAIHVVSVSVNYNAYMSDKLYIFLSSGRLQKNFRLKLCYWKLIVNENYMSESQFIYE